MTDSPLAARFVPAVNFGPRRGGAMPDMLILHYTGMMSAQAACDWLCCAESQVSCHYLIDEEGVVTQMVREADRAWHAGVSHWRGDTDINSRSIGIEIQNPGHELGYHPFPQRQMDAVAALSRDIVSRYRMPPQHVLAHSDVAPLRKIDPGEQFDWAMLHARGVGHWVPPVPLSDDGGSAVLAEGSDGQPVQALQGLLAAYGYGLDITGVFDSTTAAVVRAFQRHFRPARVDGIADRSTVATLHQLLTSQPANHREDHAK